MLAVSVTLTSTMLYWTGGIVAATVLWFITRKIGRKIKTYSAKRREEKRVLDEIYDSLQKRNRELEKEKNQEIVELRMKLLPGKWYPLYVACVNSEPRIAFNLIHSHCRGTYKVGDDKITPAAANALLKTVVYGDDPANEDSILGNIAATMSTWIEVEEEYTPWPQEERDIWRNLLG